MFDVFKNELFTRLCNFFKRNKLADLSYYYCDLVGNLTKLQTFIFIINAK